ncbi:hypothetical protein [Sphingomonas sp. S2M10]|uniref:hypothetical protein n=1 Tax=Sphingomonas sp. S2M10 TaxID=2705010 RepID=UPI0014571AEA|nr:hypothetical protein [Sphingomonas sp. S2M10]
MIAAAAVPNCTGESSPERIERGIVLRMTTERPENALEALEDLAVDDFSRRVIRGAARD